MSDRSAPTLSPKPFWGEVARTAIAERGLTATAAAAAIGTSPASLSAWLNGHSEPPLKDFRVLAAVAGLPFAYLLYLADRIPPELSGISNLLLAERSARTAIDELERGAAAARSIVDQPAAAAIVGAVLERCPGWRAVVQPRLRGIDHRGRAQTFIGLEPVDDTVKVGQSEREWLEDQLQGAINRTGAVWRAAHQLESWPYAPEMVLMVLDQERSRGPKYAYSSETFAAGVIGPPYAHAELVASVIADECGFGLINPLDLAQRRFGFTRDNDPRRRGMTCVMEEVLAGAISTLRHVWTCAEPEVLDTVDLDEVSDPVVVVLPGPKLLAEGARYWRYPIGEMQNLAKRLEHVGARRRNLTFQIEDKAVFRGGKLDADRLWDAAWEIGLEATMALTA